MVDSWSPFKEIIETSIIDNKCIADCLEYDGYSQWWSIEYNIHNDALNNNLPPKGITNSRIYLKIRCNKTINLLFNFVYDLTNYCIFYIERKIFQPNKEHDSAKATSKIVYLQEIMEWRDDTKNNNNSQTLKNIYHSDIISQLPPQLKIITVYNADIISFKEHHSKYPHIISSDKRTIPCVYWKYWSWQTWLYEKRSIMHFYDIWNRISDKDIWFTKWNRFAKTNDKEVKNYFKKLILLLIPKATSYFAMVDQLIRIEKPSVIIMTDEYSMYGRALINAAKKHNILSIAIQHGLISENHTKYCRNHDPHDVSVKGKEIGTSYPIPDITCVWGKSQYEILVNCAGYPKDQVIITGNPRYDYLSHATEKYSRDTFYTKYNINPNNRIILWATGTHGENYEDNIAYINEVISACNVIPNVTLIIKQHPNEQPEHTKIYRDAMEKNKDRFQIILPDKMEDTTEMVFSSDILIIRASTVGQEAVAFHKPIIILDFSEKKDLLEYVKENVAVPAYCEGSLRNALITCLQNSPITRDNQDIYITNYMNKIDGLAAKRIAKLIEDSIAKNNT